MPFLCADSGPWRNLESCWKCWCMCWTHLQMFSVSTVLGEGLWRGAVLRSRCQASWPSPTTTLDRKRTSKGRHHVWWVERFAIIVFCWGMCIDVWVNAFKMPFLCADSGPCEWMSFRCHFFNADSGPWRKMSSAWFSMYAITTSSGTAWVAWNWGSKNKTKKEKNESAPKEKQQPPNALKMKEKKWKK